MRIRVRLFASVREIVGRQEVIVDVPEGVTSADLLRQLVSQYPELRRQAPSLRLAVNHEYVEGGRRLAEADDVALIPPVSGGVDLFEVTEFPLSLDVMAKTVAQSTSGAIASFLGVVRESSRGRRVDHLEYDAYPEMAVVKMRQIGEEIQARWPVDRVAIVHRVGRLTVGEASVAIAVASPHRQEALQACAYAIERLKEIVPIWKKEVWADGSEWIGSTVDEYQQKSQGSGGKGQE
jgi:MoaE-MoaD fusion protein